MPVRRVRRAARAVDVGDVLVMVGLAVAVIGLVLIDWRWLVPFFGLLLVQVGLARG